MKLKPPPQLELFLRPAQPAPQGEESVLVGALPVPLRWRRNPRAKRYILRVMANGVAWVTIPRGGSQAAGRDFAWRNRAWIERQLQRPPPMPPTPRPWQHGSEICYRGERVPLVVESTPDRVRVTFANQSLHFSKLPDNLRPAVENRLRQLAFDVLVPRTWELAADCHVEIHRVTVRDQRSRWGSCSVRGTISLNWRLIQAPAFVSDYLILHELMHRREPNHSARFWRLVEEACPDYLSAEAWLKGQAKLLRQG